MPRHPTGERKYEIQHLWELHREVIRRLVLGQRPRDIAADLGITPQTVSNIQNSKIAQAEIERLRNERDEEVQDIAKQLQELAPRAVNVLEQIIDSDEVPTNIKLKAAQDVLDRAGYGAVQKSISMHTTLTPDEIERIRARGQELKQLLYNKLEEGSKVEQTVVVDSN